VNKFAIGSRTRAIAVPAIQPDAADEDSELSFHVEADCAAGGLVGRLVRGVSSVEELVWVSEPRLLLES
jgi:hypothetical protein